MNKYLLSIKLILILCLSLQAQTSDIQIKVLTEAENEPLLGATVYFEALEKGAVTDFDGIATFTEIPDGKHQIIISFFPNNLIYTYSYNSKSEAKKKYKLLLDNLLIDEINGSLSK